MQLSLENSPQPSKFRFLPDGELWRSSNGLQPSSFVFWLRCVNKASTSGFKNWLLYCNAPRDSKPVRGTSRVNSLGKKASWKEFLKRFGPSSSARLNRRHVTAAGHKK